MSFCRGRNATGLIREPSIMFNAFAQLEKNLGRAGWLLALAFLGFIALSFALSELGHDAAFGMLGLWVAMPLVAWFMSKAAAVQGKNRWLYGLASLLPPLALVSFFSLVNRDSMAKTEAGARRHDP